MPDEIGIAVGASQFEVPMVRGQPCVDYLGDSDPAASKAQGARRLLAAMARIALHVDSERVLFRHSVMIGQ